VTLVVMGGRQRLARSASRGKDWGSVCPTLTSTRPTVSPLLRDSLKSSWTVNSAELAYMTFQAPALVAVHAHEILPKGPPDGGGGP
jgi:hypothetical protein